MKSIAGRVSASFNLGSYVEPDVLSSFEYFKTFQRRDYLLPEVKLMFAVLSDGIECFQRYAGAKSRRQRRIFAETATWIFSDDDEALFSFASVCAALQLDASFLRRGLRRWLAQAAINNSEPRVYLPSRCRGVSRSLRIAI